MSPKQHSGFTLIELMIVVAIIGILAGIAYPSYLEYVARSRRADAMSSLHELAQAMERHYTVNGRYTAAGGAAPALPFSESPRDGNARYYDLSFLPDSVSANTYTLRAVPKNAQAGDRCGTLNLTHTGLASGAQADCVR